MKKIIIFLTVIYSLTSFNLYAMDFFNPENEEVTIIVETYKNGNLHYDEVHKKIKLLSPSVSEIRYRYDDIFYGFSVIINNQDIEIIKKINDIKNIYISGTYKVPEYKSADINDFQEDIELMGEEKQYTGKGMIVAVLDSEFRVDHNCFAEPDEYKYSYNDMQNFYENFELFPEKKGVTFEKTWYSNKIPFYYDYGEKDTDTMKSGNANIHGTLVSSLVGGKSNLLKNYATQTQLALLKISDNKGNLTEEAIFAALDDAYKLKVDAVNMSFGDAPGFVNKWSQNVDSMNFNLISKKFKEAGIPIFVATGNSSHTGSELLNNKYYPLASNPDVGVLSSYATQTDVLSVGAIRIQENQTSVIAPYSSIGATNDLRIAPDLVYNGDQIAAYPDSENSYLTETKSGTSFSSPLTASLYIACKEYYKEMYPHMSDVELNQTIEQAMMSTAELITTNGIPVSPRMQGAGCPDFDKTIKTPVVLIGSDNKSKINLFDTTDNYLDFSFNAKNISENSVSYSTKLTLTTDGYIDKNAKVVTNNASDGKNSLSLTDDSSTSYPAYITAEKLTAEAGKKYTASCDFKLKSGNSLRLILRFLDKDGKKLSDKQFGTTSSEWKHISISVIAPANTANCAIIITGMGSLSGEAYVDNIKLEEENEIIFKDSFENGMRLWSPLSKNGVKYVNILRPRKIDNFCCSFDCGNSVTLAPGENKEIKVHIDIPEELINEMQSVFTNGYFLEGFIELISEDDNLPDLSIPYMSFKGVWDSVPIMDEKNVYDAFGFYSNESNLSLEANNIYYINPEKSTFRLGVLRNISKLDVLVIKDNKIIDSSSITNKKVYIQNKSFIYTSFPSYALLDRSMDDGEYYIGYKAKADTKEPKAQQLIQKVMIDRTIPELTSFSRIFKDKKIYLDFCVKDNIKLKSIIINKYKGNDLIDTFYSADITNKNLKEYSDMIDITDSQLYNYEIVITDEALNKINYIKNENSFNSYIAAYDSEKRLVSVVLRNGILTLDDANSEASVINNDSIENIKYFIWDGLLPFTFPITLK